MAAKSGSLTELQKRYTSLCKAAGKAPIQRLLQTIDQDILELRGLKINDLESFTYFTALQYSVSIRSLCLECNDLGSSGAIQLAQFLRESVSLAELVSEVALSNRSFQEKRLLKIAH
uniref:Protein NLRC3 n=1 Tax=Macrostomum lignano TaxID=282301 RepID=A0A1I8FYL8_9PLAT